MTLLTVKNVSKHYKNKKAVDNVNFNLYENTCVALLGPNGAMVDVISKRSTRELA